MFNISNIFNMFKTTDYKAIFESDDHVLLGRHKVIDHDVYEEEFKITVPMFEVKPDCGMWKLIRNDRDVWFPTRWYKLEGEELRRVINEDYDLYKAKASGKDEYLLKQFKPLIDDAVRSGYYCALFKSKESAIIAGKIAIFLGDIEGKSKVKNKPDWIY